MPKTSLQTTDDHARARKKLEFLDALELERGILSSAARRIDVHRITIRQWIKQDPVFEESVREVQDEFVVDYVESKLLDLAGGVNIVTDEGVVYQQKPDIQAVKTFLSAKGKSLGYETAASGAKGKASAINETTDSATGRERMVTQDHVFQSQDGSFAVKGDEFLTMLEQVASTQELKVIQDVFERTRVAIQEKAAIGNDGGNISG